MIKNGNGLIGLFFVFLFVLYSGSSHLMGQTQAKYSIEFENTTIESSVQKMKTHLGVNFFYDSKSLKKEEKLINKVFSNNTLDEILKSILEGTGLIYNVVNNVIIIAPKENIVEISKTIAKDNVVSIKGVVVDKSDTPIEMATVLLPDYNLWGTTDSKGIFTINRVIPGTTKLIINCLGFKTLDTTIIINKSIDNLKFKLKDENLKLQSVTITATENKNVSNTSIKIDRQAIDHLQVISSTDIMSLLPGGQTVNSNLFYRNQNIFEIRGGGGDGNFGTAIEVDGIRLSSNSNMSTTFGVDTRSLPVSNLESIEVVTGIPTVEYGDMTSGMVIIKTKKGRTPYSVTVSQNPTTRQFSISKGFDLLKDRGILNVNTEYTHAFQNPVTPYRTYVRNGYGINYTNTFNRENRPVQFSAKIGGTIGRLNSKPDPDIDDDIWTSSADNTLMFGASAKWLINSKYITNLDFNLNASYSDNIQKQNDYFFSATIRPSINSTESGYFETNYLPAQFSNLKIVDSKGLSYGITIKANLNRKFGNIMNKLKFGVGWRSDGNIGKGEYYEQNIYPDGYRPRSYTEIPFLHNWNTYLEDNVNIPIGKTSLSLTGGVRVEGNIIKDMNYKNVVSVSPRFNGRYTLIDNKDSKAGLLKNLSIRGGWGILEKLPSLAVLYPKDNYNDIMVYSKNYGTQNDYFYVAKTNVFRDYFNPDLKWSKSRNIEVGIDAKIGGMRASIVYYNNKSVSPYMTEITHVPYTYSKTDENYTVPNNPGFKVDKLTGNIYVMDKNNPSFGEVLIPKSVTDTTFIARGMQSNEEPSTRQGVELTLDFGRIESIKTSFKFDASYSYSKEIYERLRSSYPAGRHSTLPTNLGRSYEFVAYYLGGTGTYWTHNGSWKDNLTANFTTTTHIPEIRMTISLRLEGTFFLRSQNLTYHNGEEWAFLLDENGNKINKSVYKQKEYYSGVWPVAYKGFDGVIKPFTETQAQDRRFASMLGRDSNVYTYALDGNGVYFMANLNITKEIGDLLSISFYANNFTKSNPYLKSWATGVKTAKNILFSYGATLRIKF